MVHLNAKVKKVKWTSVGNSKRVEIQYVNEKNQPIQINADAVVITVPIGVLQQEAISFDPPIPQWKSSVIKAIGNGLVNKVFMQFPFAFWRKTSRAKPGSEKSTKWTIHQMVKVNLASREGLALASTDASTEIRPGVEVAKVDPPAMTEDTTLLELESIQTTLIQLQREENVKANSRAIFLVLVLLPSNCKRLSLEVFRRLAFPRRCTFLGEVSFSRCTIAKLTWLYRTNHNCSSHLPFIPEVPLRCLLHFQMKLGLKNSSSRRIKRVE